MSATKQSGLGRGQVLDQFGGSGFRSTGWGNGGGGRGASAPVTIPNTYTPGGSGLRLPSQARPTYRPQFPAKGRPVSPIRRPPTQQPQPRPDRAPLPRGFKNPPQQGRPNGKNTPKGRSPKGKPPAAATPKGFGQPRVKETPLPQPQRPPQFDPFKPQPVKPASPYYKPIPRPFGPGGYPVTLPSLQIPPLYQDPTGKTLPVGFPIPINPANSFKLPDNGQAYTFRIQCFGQVAGGFDFVDSAVGGAVVVEFSLYETSRSSLGFDVDIYTAEISYINPFRGRVKNSIGGYIQCRVGAVPEAKIISLVENLTGQPYFPESEPQEQPPFLAAPPITAPPPVRIPDTIPPNLPDIYPGLPDPEYPEVPDDAPQLPPTTEPEPEPDPEEESPSPRTDPDSEPTPTKEPDDDDIAPLLPPFQDPDPFGDEPEFPWKSPDPAPKPTPEPTPIPNPDPKPKPIPVPIPIPGPDPGTTPSPDPKPKPIPVPIPIPGPDPGTTPSPDPKPKPIPVPIPVPSPDPKPTPIPVPLPNPLPLPLPDPVPGQQPTPTDPRGPDIPGGPGDGGDRPPNSSPDDFRPRPFDPKRPPSGLPLPPRVPPAPPLPPPLPPFFDDDPKEPNPVDDFTPPQFIPPKVPASSGGSCKNNACLVSIENAAQGAKDAATNGLDKLEKLLERLAPVLQVLDVSLLVLINDKLGPKLPGGLSKWIERIDKVTQSISNTVGAIQEKLGKFAKWARLGQLVSVLTLITTLHNALMLSRSVGETLLSMLSNGLAVFGIKDDGGNPYELGELIGKSVENMMKETIGTANYTTLSTNFKKANRIYQAAANLGNSIQSMRFSVVSALETIGGWNARIGNALKRSGVVNESSYSWMNPSPNFDNKFTQALETVENTVSQIDSVASEILSAQETVTQIGTQKTELLNSLGLGTEKPQTENQPQKDKAIASKAASVSLNIEATDLNKPGV